MPLSEDMIPDERDRWASMPEDPDLERDLGYTMLDLEIVDVPVTGETMFLPKDEDMLKDDAFIVVSDGLVSDVLEHR